MLNKADLVDIALYQWVIGLYSQLGYETVVTSAVDGRGVDRLGSLLAHGVTAVSGQSGVGKSSLLECRPARPQSQGPRGVGLDLQGQAHHLGRRADPPGSWRLRRRYPWSAAVRTLGRGPGELEGYFVEFRPYIPHCRFPDCSHTHETGCAVKEAVHWGQIHQGRYESYLKLFHRSPVEGE